MEALRQSVIRSPRRSASQHAAALGMSDRSARRMLHLDLHFHPYKFAVVQELSELYLQKRRECAQSILNILNDDAIIFMSDEAHFHLSGCVNKQNFRYWAPANPRVLHERPLHCERVTVWCGVAQFSVIGPYFFEEDGHTVSVTSARYVQMLNNFLAPELARRGIANIWFQQDGATAHTARMSMGVVQEMFPGRVLSRNGDLSWPARSPDLTMCDYFLWGYLKSKVYILEDLKLLLI